MFRSFRTAVFLVSLLGLIVLTACGRQPSVEREAPDLWPVSGDWTDATLHGLTLEEKVSQLFASYAYGNFKSADDPDYLRLVRLVEDFGVLRNKGWDFWRWSARFLRKVLAYNLSLRFERTFARE